MRPTRFSFLALPPPLQVAISSNGDALSALAASPAEQAIVDTAAVLRGAAVKTAAQTPMKAEGSKSARDFSFLVTEDKHESDLNLTMLDHDSDSDSNQGLDGPRDGDGNDDTGFEAGSAIDQLLWRQKAVSGMETRRPGESVQQFFQRRMAGMRMLKAEAGSSEAKNLETEAPSRIRMKTSFLVEAYPATAWHSKLSILPRHIPLFDSWITIA